MKYSIIIPTYNKCFETLEPCINSFIEFCDFSNNDIEIIVVANGCTDETAEFLRSEKLFDVPIKTLWFKEPIGYTKATNEGIKKARGEYIVCLNNDTVLLAQSKNDWLKILEQPFLTDQAVGITGCMKEHCPHADRKFLLFFCVMIARKVIDKIGLLDESFSPGYGEDCDYCCKAEDVGFKILQVPDESNNYYAENRKVGNFPLYHIGNVTFKNWPDGDKLLEKNNNILRERYLRPQGLDGKHTGNAGEQGAKGFDVPKELAIEVNGLMIERAKTCDGFMTDPELLWLANTASKLPQKSIVVEIGSWHGKSSRAIADNLSLDSILYCVDTWNGSVNEQATWHQSAKMKEGDHAYYEFLQNNIDLVQAGKIIPLRMSSKNASDFFKEKYIEIDLCFIDAAHDYDSVRKDIEQWHPLMNDGGIICGHDYVGNSGMEVIQAVDNYFKRPVGSVNGTSIWKVDINSNVDSKAVSVIAMTAEELRPKIYDCFPFFNELDILEIRFNELYDVVDRFIIVEATKTHGGTDKPLYFLDNLKRFEKFLHKVTHIVVQEYPALDSWSIERHQRDSIMKGLTDCKDNDIIMISDVDEIPKAETIKQYDPAKGLCCLRQKLYYYYLNCQATQDWDWLRILPYGKMKTMSPCEVRYTVNYDTEKQIIKDGGWHLSYMGGIDMIIEKIGASAHQEYNTPEIKDRATVTNLVENAKDVFQRPLQYEFRLVADCDLPEHVRNNLDKYAHLFKKILPLG